MGHDKKRHHRKSIRLDGYDYSKPGGYGVTLCATMKHHYFGRIENGKVILSNIGKIAAKCWIDIPRHFPTVSIDRYIIMPNHVHGILWIKTQSIGNERGESSAPICRGVQLNAPTAHRYFSSISPQKDTLGVIVRTYKAAVSSLCHKNNLIGFAWQRNYYERIIRNDRELFAMRQYIINNPANWDEDELNG